MRRPDALSSTARAASARRLLGRRLPDLQTPITPLDRLSVAATMMINLTEQN